MNKYITIFYILILFILPFNFKKREVVVDKQIEYIKLENEIKREQIIKYKNKIIYIDKEIERIKYEKVDDTTLINNLKYELNKNNNIVDTNF